MTRATILILILLSAALAKAQQHDCRTMRSSELDGYDGPVKQVIMTESEAVLENGRWVASKNAYTTTTLYDKKGWMTKRAGAPTLEDHRTVTTAHPPVKGRIDMQEAHYDNSGELYAINISQVWLDDHSYKETIHNQVACKGPDMRYTCHHIITLDKGCRMVHVQNDCSEHNPAQTDYAYKGSDTTMLTYGEDRTVAYYINRIILSRDMHGNMLQVLVKLPNNDYTLEEYAYEYY